MKQLNINALRTFMFLAVRGHHHFNGTLTISEKQPATVTKVPTAKTLTYTGSAQALVTAGTASGGEMWYALGTETEATQPYTISIPSATDVETYYVWYKVLGDGNHNDTEPASVEVKIAEPEKEPEKDQPGDNPKTVAAAAGFGAVTLAAASVIVSKKRKK